MRIGTGFYKTSREIKDKIKKQSDKIAYDIFDFLCDYAEWLPTTEDRRGIKVEINKGQIFTSESEIEAHFLEWGEKIGRTVIRNRLQKLAALDLIVIEDIYKGKQPLGKKITVNYLRVQYESLEPQGIEGNDVQQKAENVQHNVQYNVQQNVQQSALQPQVIEGIDVQQNIQQNVQQNVQPFLKEVKEVKEVKEKDLKKEQQKISENQSLVNTFSTSFDYFLQRFENEFLIDRPEATIGQVKALKEFTTKIEKDLLDQLFQEAGEGSKSNPISYLFEICRENIKNGITTLDKKLQNAALYKKRDQQHYKQTGTEGRQRQEAAVPDIDYDNMF